jgi:hypothetical protein
MLIMPDLYSLLRPPYFELILGVISLSGAVVSTLTGTTRARFSGLVYRDKEPRLFLVTVASYYFMGIGFIGYFLYVVSWPISPSR